MQWKDFGFEMYLTGDQSPTLKKSGQDAEHMHHLGGAYSESDYIYSPVFDLHADLSSKKWASVGLGLGYNEFLWAQKTYHDKTSLISYENHPDLRKLFIAFLQDDLPDGEVKETYQMVSQFFKPALKTFLKEQLDENFILKPDFHLDHILGHQFHGYIYDAYSGKVSPELWEEDFLKKVLQESSASHCVFATYSCTSRLKNTLTSAGFEVQRIKGFQNKKHSLLAVKKSEVNDED